MAPNRGSEALDKVLALSMLVTSDLERFETAEQMTTPRVRLLWQLGVTGPSTQRDLAASLDVSPRNITGLVDGLVASGHVTREPHPSDRRATLVTTTTKGTTFVAQQQRSHAELAEQLFGDMGERRLSAFVAALDATSARFATLMDKAR